MTVIVYDNVAPASASNDVTVYRTVPEAVSSFLLIVAGKFVNVGTLLRSEKRIYDQNLLEPSSLFLC